MQVKKRRNKGKKSCINFLDAATGLRRKKGKKTHPCKIFNRFFPQTNTSGVRIGIIADQEGDCNFPDSRIGFGGEFENACGNGASWSAEINTI